MTIVIKDETGKSLLKTDKDLKDLFFSYVGGIDKITPFDVEPEDYPITIDESLLDLLYKYWWGTE
jgi:hypothetical protein